MLRSRKWCVTRNLLYSKANVFVTGEYPQQPQTQQVPSHYGAPQFQPEDILTNHYDNMPVQPSNMPTNHSNILTSYDDNVFEWPSGMANPSDMLTSYDDDVCEWSSGMANPSNIPLRQTDQPLMVSTLQTSRRR
ncbi:uncharacterized protein BDZ99DRAFT_538570 [Mytilinidion resinicola]|uniref:Uncharacterized protein n=1 Tax=Mytilinidion resinicola TaxID=574789 RepID=A0A6A6YE39_9PEZI|nr:uncharacterized protein BDZ99DRAFT_538570 [Mytilinidion resinicola]KAF2806345.1 hypothetical protein BDZ99DRAFT_538570 [Mytilinidion resinicola]